jgi:predicted dehydrogenase
MEYIMLNIAVVGAGGYSFELIQRIWRLPHKYNFVAVTSDPKAGDSGRNACVNRGGIAVYDNVDSMLSSIGNKVDLIFVPTSIHTHFKVAAKCISAGYDVFLEKPPVVTIQDFDELSRLSKLHEKRIMVGFQYLYCNVVQTIKKYLCQEKYGRIKSVRSSAGWPRLDSYYKNGTDWVGRLRIGDLWVLDGSINNPLSHMLANSLYFGSSQPHTMAKPVTIQAELYRGHDIESEDTSSIRIMTEDSVEITYNATLCSAREITPKTIIECEGATIEYVNFDSATITAADKLIETLRDDNEKRTHMLETAADSFTDNTICPGELDVCRPFTLSVNGAFESSGPPRKIDCKYIERIEQGDDVKTVIKGIDEVLLDHANNGKLLSETASDWAQSGEKIDLREYDYFPSKRFMNALNRD